MASSAISSTRFDAPLCVELTPSRTLRRVVWLGVGAAVLSLAVLPFPVAYRLLAVLGVVVLSRLRWCQRVHGQPSALRWVAGPEWSLMLDGCWRDAPDLQCTYLTRALLIVTATPTGAARLRFPLLADQTDPESWRRLRRRLLRGKSTS